MLWTRQQPMRKILGPAPERRTTSQPASQFHAAIRRANTSRQAPDRGGWLPVQGFRRVLPDGTVANTSKGLKPILFNLLADTRRIVEQGGNTAQRQMQLATLKRNAYLEVVKKRDVVAAASNAAPALHWAQRYRPKPNSKGLRQGFRNDLVPHRRVGVVHTQAVAPKSINVQVAFTRTAGTGADVRAPIPQPTVRPAASISAASFNTRAYSLRTSATDVAAEKSGGQASIQTPERMERILLLVGVGVAAFFLLRR